MILVAGCTSRLEKAIGNLKNDDPSVRYLAVGELQELDDERTIPHLLTALHDEDTRVVRRAIGALGNYSDDQAIESLVGKLTEKNPLIWIAASKALIRIGPPAVEALISVITHENTSLVEKTAAVLGEIGTRQTVEPLITLLAHPSDTVRATAATALGRVEDVRSIPVLVKALKDENPIVQYDAARALYQLRPYSTVPLIEALGSKNDDTVVNAVSVLGKIGGSEVINALGSLLDHSSAFVRIEVVMGLGTYANNATTTFLISALNDNFVTVQNLAADYLVKIGSGAVGLLLAALDGGDAKLTSKAILTLGRIGDARAVEPLIDILSNRSSAERKTAAVALGMLGDPLAIPSLIDALRSENADLSSSAAEALIKTGTPSVAPLIDLLGNDDPSVRVKSILVLLNLKTKATQPLIDALQRKEKIIRKTAEHILVWIALPAVEPLIGVLAEKDPELREVAKKVLLKIGSPAVKGLAVALENRPDDLRIEIIGLLGEIGDYAAVSTLLAMLRDRRISSEAAKALDIAKWKPVYPADRIHYLIARQETSTLLAEWDQTYKVLRHELLSGDKNASEYAVYALVELKGEAIIPKLMEILKGRGDNEIAHAYAKALIESFKKGNIALQTAATNALITIGSPAIQPLIDALGDKDQTVREAAATTLEKMGPIAVKPLEEALNHTSHSVRATAATMLGRSGDKSVVPALKSALLDWEICQQVALALDALGWNPQTPYDQVYYRVAKGHTKELQREWDLTLETLMRNLRSGREKQTEYAVLALLSINPKTVIPKLKALLAHEGDITLVKAYYASGNSQLIIAALDWAINNGYFEIILNQ